MNIVKKQKSFKKIIFFNSIWENYFFINNIITENDAVKKKFIN